MAALGWLINLGFAASPSTTAAVETTPETYSGGYSWRWFDQEMYRRKKRKREQELAEERAKELQDELDRQLALELQKKNKELERVTDLKQLIALAERNKQQIAQLDIKVINALERAIVQGNYSAMEAFERELSKVREEEEFLFAAWHFLMEA